MSGTDIFIQHDRAGLILILKDSQHAFLCEDVYIDYETTNLSCKIHAVMPLDQHFFQVELFVVEVPMKVNLKHKYQTLIQI